MGLIDFITRYISFPFRLKIKAKDKNIHSIVMNEIKKYGKNANLNHIDVSEVTDMSELFQYIDFQGDISKWNVSNVKNMTRMFSQSTFNGDISKWNLENLEIAEEMFIFSNFNSDISNWKFKKLKNMERMFFSSKFSGDINDWQIGWDMNLIGIWQLKKEQIPFWLFKIQTFKTEKDYKDSLMEWNWVNLDKKIIWKSRFSKVIKEWELNIEDIDDLVKIKNFIIK